MFYKYFSVFNDGYSASSPMFLKDKLVDNIHLLYVHVIISGLMAVNQYIISDWSIIK